MIYSFEIIYFVTSCILSVVLRLDRNWVVSQPISNGVSHNQWSNINFLYVQYLFLNSVLTAFNYILFLKFYLHLELLKIIKNEDFNFNFIINFKKGQKKGKKK